MTDNSKVHDVHLHLQQELPCGGVVEMQSKDVNDHKIRT